LPEIGSIRSPTEGFFAIAQNDIVSMKIYFLPIARFLMVQF
jgi:hypothetical protein